MKYLFITNLFSYNKEEFSVSKSFKKDLIPDVNA